MKMILIEQLVFIRCQHLPKICSYRYNIRVTMMLTGAHGAYDQDS